MAIGNAAVALWIFKVYSDRAFLVALHDAIGYSSVIASASIRKLTVSPTGPSAMATP